MVLYSFSMFQVNRQEWEYYEKKDLRYKANNNNKIDWKVTKWSQQLSVM